jgi:predicted glycosyltransferase
VLFRSGVEIDANWRNQRKQQLLNCFAAFDPQVLITETFPFGRRMMRFELLPLLAAARASTNCIQVIASVRDILQPKSKVERIDETCELIEKYYAHVLVHGDVSIARLEESFSAAARIDQKVSYSGYICADTNAVPPGSEGCDEVLVSAGSSATGFEILEAAITAKSQSSLRDLHWRILVSPAIDENRFEELKQLAGEGVCIERNRADFSELVKRARLSISQAGYNTMTDVLSSDTPAVVIPYAEATEIEQTLRAQILQHHDRVIMLRQDELSATSIASAVDQAIRQFRPLQANLAGAVNSATMIRQWHDEAMLER